MSWLDFIFKLLLLLPEIIKIILEFKKNNPSKPQDPSR